MSRERAHPADERHVVAWRVIAVLALALSAALLAQVALGPALS